MEEVQAGNVRTPGLDRELPAALAAHLPPKHIDAALHSLWDFANKQSEKWRTTRGARCARVLSGSDLHSSQI